MTATIDTDVTAAGIVHVPPGELLVDGNIRVDVDVDQAFIDSIADLGVLQPIVAVRTDDGQLRVRFGQRRTLAAVQAARAAVPVIVVDDDDDEQLRIIEQWAENEHRAGLSTKDRVAAVEQLALLGLSAEDIVDRTRSSKDLVGHALATSRSTLAKATVARYDLTLDQAAAVAEFEDDTDVVKDLVVVARERPENFAHILQRARDNRAEAEKRAELVAGLERKGIPLADPADVSTWDSHKKGRPLDSLKAGGADGSPYTARSHAKCPGHAAIVQAGYYDGPPMVVYVCTDWKSQGHVDRYGGSSSTSTSSPKDKAAASAERKEVIENNKAWRSAETVRRAWLKTFLAAKTPPKGTAKYLAAELAHWDYPLQNMQAGGRHSLAAELLGIAIDRGSRAPLADAAQKATDGRAQVIGLAIVLCAIEASADVHTWRRSNAAQKRYFEFLEASGYALSDVEQLVIKPARKSRRSRS